MAGFLWLGFPSAVRAGDLLLDSSYAEPVTADQRAQARADRLALGTNAAATTASQRDAYQSGLRNGRNDDRLLNQDFTDRTGESAEDRYRERQGNLVGQDGLLPDQRAALQAQGLAGSGSANRVYDARMLKDEASPDLRTFDGRDLNTGNDRNRHGAGIDRTVELDRNQNVREGLAASQSYRPRGGQRGPVYYRPPER